MDLVTSEIEKINANFGNFYSLQTNTLVNININVKEFQVAHMAIDKAINTIKLEMPPPMRKPFIDLLNEVKTDIVIKQLIYLNEHTKYEIDVFGKEVAEKEKKKIKLDLLDLIDITALQRAAIGVSDSIFRDIIRARTFAFGLGENIMKTSKLPIIVYLRKEIKKAGHHIKMLGKRAVTTIGRTDKTVIRQTRIKIITQTIEDSSEITATGLQKLFD